MYKCEVIGLLVLFCMAGMITIAHVQADRTVTIRFVGEWRQGYDFARDARIEINGVIQHEWTFSHSTDQAFQDTLDTTITNTIKAYTIYARDDDLQSRYYGHLYVDGSLVASSDDAGPLTPLVYVMSPEQACQPPSLNLFTPEVNGLTVRVNGVTMPGCSGVTVTHLHWDWGDGQSGDYWFPASHTYGSGGTYGITVTAYQSDGLSTAGWVSATATGTVCSEGAVRVLETCPDGTWKHRQVCRNNAWSDEYQQCPIPHVCDEGAVRVLETCPDGYTWRHRQVCRNNAWSDEYQQCPTPRVCSEGAVNVLQTCPDGYTWNHRQVCRNNAWHDEYQQCPTPPGRPVTYTSYTIVTIAVVILIPAVFWYRKKKSDQRT